MCERDVINLELATLVGLQNQEHLTPLYEEQVSSDGEEGYSGFYCPRCKCPEGEYKKRPCAPDWYNSRDDVANLEAMLTDEQIPKYLMALDEQVSHKSTHPLNRAFARVTADPSERCKALINIHAIGLHFSPAVSKSHRLANALRDFLSDPDIISEAYKTIKEFLAEDVRDFGK